jgi:carbamoyl-phosphate synthase large subunit
LAAGVLAVRVYKLADQRPPTVLDFMIDNKVQLVVNTSSGTVARQDERTIRSQAILRGIPIVTTESGARATLDAIRHVRQHGWTVKALQDYY